MNTTEIRMRMLFSQILYKEMVSNKDIYLVVGDLGYFMFDAIFSAIPERSFNVNASEQAGLDMCVGLSLAGKLPIFYSITPFTIYRPFETIRTYIDHEKTPLILVGSGQNYDYSHDGHSHHSHDIKGFMEQFNNIISYYPDSNDRLMKDWSYERDIHQFKRPLFINLSR